jgi:hypothetical protein
MAPLEVSAWSVAVWGLTALRRPGLALGVQAAAVALLARRLDGLVRDPVAVATRIAAGGTARAAGPALAAVTRTWSPLLVLGLAFRRTRRTAALAFLLPAWHDRRRTTAPLDALADLGLHVADDVAYGLGVWAGCVRARTAVPLLPRLVWRSRTWSPGTLRRDLGQGGRTPSP